MSSSFLPNCSVQIVNHKGSKGTWGKGRLSEMCAERCVFASCAFASLCMYVSRNSVCGLTVCQQKVPFALKAFQATLNASRKHCSVSKGTHRPRQLFGNCVFCIFPFGDSVNILPAGCRGMPFTAGPQSKVCPSVNTAVLFCLAIVLQASYQIPSAASYLLC